MRVSDQVGLASGQDHPHVRMREIRRSLKMRQAELGRLLGLSRESICRIEKGRPPRKRKLAVIEIWMERNNATRANFERPFGR